MDARRIVLMALAISFLLVNWCVTAQAQTAFRAQSKNFVVTAADEVLAKQVAHEAERYRRELALEWLGHEIADWHQKCPIQVELGPHSGGETTFVFVGPPGQAQPTEWSMKIFGPANRLLDAVLPHEVTHTIFATHFGRPLPRWADEGACTTVEHESERKKIQGLLMDYLTARPSRGIPFNRLFLLMQYPDDMLPLYAQSYSLAQFLVLQQGRQHFIKFVERGLALCPRDMTTPAWDLALREFYGFQDLSELQVAWVDWVKAGSPDTIRVVPAIAANDPNVGSPASTRVGSSINPGDNTGTTWYHRQMTVTNSPVRDGENISSRHEVADNQTSEQNSGTTVVGPDPVFSPRINSIDREPATRILRR